MNLEALSLQNSLNSWRWRCVISKVAFFLRPSTKPMNTCVSLCFFPKVSGWCHCGWLATKTPGFTPAVSFHGSNLGDLAIFQNDPLGAG